MLTLGTASGAMFQELPQTMPPPPPRPEASKTAEKSVSDESMPAEEMACRARLRELGVTFEEHPPLKEASGCEAPHPLKVSSLPGNVVLRPDAVLSCAMAEATARFVADHAAPAVQKELDASLAAIDQVSSYVCRPRNGTRKLSEHAFANALDWGGIELSDGTRVEIRAYQRTEPRRSRLISTLRKTACGPFKTVLGPGSDADHADHFHFDMAERRNGGTFCQ